MTTHTPLFCACGCGQEVPQKKYPSQQNRYIQFHQHRGEHNGNYRGGDVSKACGVCGKTFSERASIINKRKTCGDDACYRTWVSLTSTARGQKKETVPCAHCGAELRLYPSQVHDYNFCNRFCQGQHNSSLFSGANNARWKGGNRQYFQAQARIRDNHRCVVCGFDLATDVHHITPLSEGGTDDFSNLLTVCPNHHRLAHLGIINLEHLRRSDWEPDHAVRTDANH